MSMIGRLIGNYKIEEKLGEGGMGAVYKGVDTMLDREVAIKALRPELTSDPGVVERFRSEAVTLAKLNHPNIATLYSLFRQGDELYMVLEFVRGETLDALLRRRGALPAVEAIPMFMQVMDGIHHAHELGIVHRDIKPANMMMTEKGTLKVLDFGIARLLGSARMTRAGNIIGTLEYMAPEQMRGLETDARSDIYSLGMMLYETLTGRVPFESPNEFELMKMQIEQAPTPPRMLNSSIPEAVEAAIMRSIAKKPERRFQSANDFREVLLDAGFVGGRAVTGTHAPRNSGATGAFDPNMTMPIISSPEMPAPSSPTTPTVAAPMNEPFDPMQTRFVPPSAPSQGFTPSSLTPPPVSSGNEGAWETRRDMPLPVPAATAPLAASLPSSVNYAAAPPAAEAGFLSKLTWVHYAGAGVALIVMLAALAAVPLILLSGAGGSPAPAVVAEPPSTTTTQPEAPLPEVRQPEAQQPQVVAAPSDSTAPSTINAPPATGDAGSLPGTPVLAPVAGEASSVTPPAEPVAGEPVRPVKREPAKPVAAPPVAPPREVAQKPAPKPPAPKKGGDAQSDRLKRAEKLLTD